MPESGTEEMLYFGKPSRRGKWLRTIFKAAPVGIVVVLNHKIIEANQKLCDMAGYAPKEIIGKNFNILYPDDSEYEFISNYHKNCMNKDSPDTIESKMKTKDGRTINIIQCSSLLNRKAPSKGMIVTVTDITKQKKVQNLLILNQQRYAIAQRAANIGSWDWDIKNDKLIWSEQIEPMSGLEPGTFGGNYKSFIESVHPDDRKYVNEQVKNCLTRKSQYNAEYRVLWPDGTIRWANATGELFLGLEDEPIRMVGAVQDITERKLAEQEIESLAKFPSENPNPVIRIAADGTVLYSNTVGYSFLENWGCRVGGKAPAHWQQYVNRILQNHSNEILEATCQGNYYSLIITPIKDAGYVNIYGTNITKIKNAEDQLRRYREHLEELVCERTEKLIKTNDELMRQIEQRKNLERQILNISEQEQQRFGQELHDSLGQQLTGISFMLQVLAQKLKKKNLPEANDIKQISELVNEATGQARALAKGLHPVDLDPESLVSSIEELTHSTEKLFKIQCVFEYEKTIELHNTESAVHLYRIAQEAITNAIKHGNTTKIKISLFVDGENGILKIENDGKDFPEKRKMPDRGIGLQIMKHRIDLLGGQLNIRTNPKGGTIVNCNFPISNGIGLRIVEYEKHRKHTKEHKDSHSR